MLGFSPLAIVPLASDVASQLVYVTGQSLALTQTSVSTTADANYTLAGLSLALTQTSVTVVSNSPNIYLQSLGVASAVSSVATGVAARIVGETIVSSQHSLGLSAEVTLTLTAQSPLALTQHSTYEAVAFSAPSQTMHTALNSMRMWNKINTTQSANWTAIDTTQNPAVKHDSLITLDGMPFVTLSGEYIITEYYPPVVWTQINTAQSPGWTDIET